jgi:hypothetical protein
MNTNGIKPASVITDAALSDLHAHMSIAGTPQRPITACEQTAQESYWIAHGKALDLQRGSHGSFAALIGDAFIRADSRNAARLISAFPDLLA